jgi:medium-chain acyl-[acyl-carrier-protein] hydrolase
VADAMLRDPDLAALLYLPLQADMEILETWVYEAEPPLPVPLVACAGSRDPTATPEALEAWREQTSERFTLHVVEGDHFYPLRNRAPLLGLLRDALSSIIGC